MKKKLAALLLSLVSLTLLAVPAAAAEVVNPNVYEITFEKSPLGAIYEVFIEQKEGTDGVCLMDLHLQLDEGVELRGIESENFFCKQDEAGVIRLYRIEFEPLDVGEGPVSIAKLTFSKATKITKAESDAGDAITNSGYRDAAALTVKYIDEIMPEVELTEATVSENSVSIKVTFNAPDKVDEALVIAAAYDGKGKMTICRCQKAQYDASGETNDTILNLSFPTLASGSAIKVFILGVTPPAIWLHPLVPTETPEAA